MPEVMPLSSHPEPATRRFVIPATTEQVLLVAAVYWALAANRLFFGAALDGRPLGAPATWGFGLALVALLVALHVFLLGLVSNRWTIKPLLSVLIVATAFATYFMQGYGIYMDPSMLRNVLRTDPAEAGELLSWALLPYLFIHAALPLALLWRVRIERRPWPRALLTRLLVLLAAVAMAAAALLAVFQPFASLMRNHTQVRYLITPANYLWSMAAVAAADARGARAPRQPVGLDAAPGPTRAGAARPRVVVLVVGETARAANWGLNGYARQTTPQLARLPVVNLSDVTACGTSTEVSLPCMFSAIGRRDYDEARIRGSESLLHVVARAGVAVRWRDNQSGCKGVCNGLEEVRPETARVPGLCDGERCLDEILLHGLDQTVAETQGNMAVILHQIGNHGPAYFKRYPTAFRRHTPACESTDLAQCSREEIINAYDNALLYTDHLLARTVDFLKSRQATHDTALIYLSDHGESLGEGGLFLHGIPYAIAPAVQTKVPMVMWFSPGYAADFSLDISCMRARAAQPATHDNLFHSVLGLLEVRTQAYEPALDLSLGCRMDGAKGRA